MVKISYQLQSLDFKKMKIKMKSNYKRITLGVSYSLSSEL